MSNQTKNLEKVGQAGETATSPLYITTRPIKGIKFTAGDIAKGQGYLGEGESRFVPTGWKAHSLVETITSKDYGKVKEK